jgi:hypothetical protein
MAGKSFKTQMNPTFKATVKIPRVGGEPMDVSFTFKAFDRKNLARVFDRWKKQNLELIKAAEDSANEGSEFTLEEWADREIAIQVDQIKDIVEGWGFSDEFSDENIEALVSTSVSVTDAILEQYNEAYNRARSGN